MKFLFFFFCIFSPIYALNYTIRLTEDHRKQIPLGGYGFIKDGHLNVTLRDYSVSNPLTRDGEIVLLFYRSLYPKTSNVLVKEEGRYYCALGNPIIQKYLKINHENTTFSLNELSESYTYKTTIMKDQEGYWSYWIINCRQDASISLTVDIEQWNYGQNHLSAGDVPLITLYNWMIFSYILTLIVWSWILYRRKANILWTHLLMWAFLCVKVVACIMSLIQYSLMKNGTSHGVMFWQFVTALTDSIVNILILTIISSGWFFIRSYLLPRDKRIFLVAVSLQIVLYLIRVLNVVFPSFSRWSSVMAFVDFLSYMVILIPIIQTKKRLRLAVQTDDRVTETVQRYQLWCHFYMITIVYLYVAKVVVYMIYVSVTYQKTWLVQASYESASLIFFDILAYMFRPTSDNPYFKIEQDVYFPLQSSKVTNTLLPPSADTNIDHV